MSFPVTTRGPQTAADWTAANPTLDQFEIGIEVNPATGAYERAKLGDGRTAWADLAYWNPSGGPKVYRALLTQTGTNAPVATVLENTLGGVPLWEYDSTGNYTATLVGAFTDGKTCLSIGPCNSFLMYVFTPGNEDVVSLGINSQAGDAVDDVLLNNYVHILVYP